MSPPKGNEYLILEAIRDGDLTVDPQGRIWRVRRRHHAGSNPCAKRRAERQSPLGYLTVRAMRNGLRLTAMAHRVVYCHLIGEIPEGLTINHKNGDKHDNRPANLELATQQEQIRHAIDVLGTHRSLHQSGEANTAAKLTADDVRAIRARRSAGETCTAISGDYDVRMEAIAKICAGTRWAHVE